jgi:hypothetical protein
MMQSLPLPVDTGKTALSIPLLGIRSDITILFTLMLCFAAPISFANEHLSKQCHPSGGIVSGAEGAWDTIFNAAKRNARIKWRKAVQKTPTMGRDWDDWGLADRNVIFGDCNDGYCCRTTRVWGVKWHQCSAYAIPCRYADISRSGEAPQPAAPAPRRTAPGLVVQDLSLKAERVSRRGSCPTVINFRAKVVATGEIGDIHLHLKGGSDGETVILDDADFIDRDNGKKVAKYNFLREFHGIVDRGYTLSVIKGRTAWGDNPRRITPVRVSSNCRTAEIDGIQHQADPRRLDP